MPSYQTPMLEASGPPRIAFGRHGMSLEQVAKRRPEHQLEIRPLGKVRIASLSATCKRSATTSTKTGSPEALPPLFQRVAEARALLSCW